MASRGSGHSRFRFFLVLLVFSTLHINCLASEEPICAVDLGPIDYDWEAYDYYAMLGLTTPKSGTSRKQRRRIREKFDQKDIRKAYRKQAQLYHPDKRNNTVSMEETNARFARIAEAYEVLSDTQKRQEYDYWLLDCEDSKKPSTRASTDSAETDPRSLFEIVFGSKREQAWDDPLPNGFFHSNQSPIRIHESREVFRDPYTGQEFLRVFQTEEFQPDASGRYRYRVISQDFAEHFSRFHGWSYQPVSEPVVIEEGYRTAHSSYAHRFSKDSLHAGETLTPHSKSLVSENGRFYAGITPECELVVMRDHSIDDVEDALVWSSDTFVPPAHAERAGGCFLSLSGPHLILALGNVNQPGSFLWQSDTLHYIDSERNSWHSDWDNAVVYFSRLENDGSLVVYRQSPLSTQSRFNQHTEAYNTKAARAWRNLKRLVLRPRNDSADTKTECVYATGPAGCNRAGRAILRLARGTVLTFRIAFSKLDGVLEAFLDALDNEDGDVLQSLAEFVGKARYQIARKASEWRGMKQ